MATITPEKLILSGSSSELDEEEESQDQIDNRHFAVREEHDDNDTKTQLEIDVNFSCIQWLVEFSLIENSIPLSIALTVYMKNSHIYASVDLQSDIKTTLSPLFIDLISKLVRNILAVERKLSETQCLHDEKQEAKRLSSSSIRRPMLAAWL